MFWGHTLEVLNRTGKVVKWSMVKVKRFYQGQSSKILTYFLRKFYAGKDVHNYIGCRNIDE